MHACRLLPDWVAAADNPGLARELLGELPHANANVLKVLLQLCYYISEQAAANEMDALALAEVLAPCVAWKPAPKPSSTSSGARWQGLNKAMSLGSKTAEHAEPHAAAAAGDYEQASEVDVRGNPCSSTDSTAIVMRVQSWLLA